MPDARGIVRNRIVYIIKPDQSLTTVHCYIIHETLRVKI